MKKIVLNWSPSGYAWSRKGMVEVLKRKGFDISSLEFHEPGPYGVGTVLSTHEAFVSRGYKGDAGDYCWKIVAGGTKYGARSLNRDDQDAISVLEEFGSEFCSGKYAELYVSSYDDMDGLLDWSIDNCDGIENLVLRESHPSY